MKSNTNIRWIEERDIKIIDSWWPHWNEKPIIHELLPENGYGGLVIERNGKIVAACYVYLTNSNMGYVDFLISDPKWKSRDRWSVLLELFEACYNAAKDAGCTEVWATSLIPGVVKRCAALGYVVSEQPHYIIWSK